MKNNYNKISGGVYLTKYVFRRLAYIMAQKVTINNAKSAFTEFHLKRSLEYVQGNIREGSIVKSRGALRVT